MPGFCVIDDEAAFRDVPRLASEIEHLALVLAAATTKEIETALRTRRFRMLVWTASCRLGGVIGYITQIKVRFVLGSIDLPLVFDATGWAVDDNRSVDTAAAYGEAYPRTLVPGDQTTQAINDMIAEGGPVPPS
jgi:hypothetical protein